MHMIAITPMDGFEPTLHGVLTVNYKIIHPGFDCTLKRSIFIEFTQSKKYNAATR